ncbi:MAG: hypothetical protein IJC99_00940 [Clostridia bacterium]|nr:hypothetical protein [Clostridia bacterium]
MRNKPLNGEQKTPHSKLRYGIFLALNTILIFGFYRVLLSIGEITGETFYAFLSMILYMALLLGFSLAYLIYNRLFLSHGVTPEELPDTMTAAEKEAYIADGKRRIESSKWMLTIIIPLLFTFLVDAVYLFIIDTFFR